MGKTVWTPDHIERMKELVWEGLTDGEIAKRLGMTEIAVCKKRQRLGVMKRVGKPIGDITRNQYVVITRAREAGWTWERIGEHANINKDTLRKAYIKTVRSGKYEAEPLCLL